MPEAVSATQPLLVAAMLLTLIKRLHETCQAKKREKYGANIDQANQRT